MISHRPSSLMPAESELCSICTSQGGLRGVTLHFSPSLLFYTLLCTLQVRDLAGAVRGQGWGGGGGEAHALPHLPLEPSRKLKTPTFMSEAESELVVVWIIARNYI